MIKRVIRKAMRVLMEIIYHGASIILDDDGMFMILSKLLKKYDVSIYFKDSMGILSQRLYNDNFSYIFKTKNSCDAIPMMKALDEKVGDSNISIDVGANIGITSIWLAKNSQIVYSFEPEIDNIKRFEENIRVNGINNIHIKPYAVSDKEGESDLFIYESYGHHSLGRVDTSNYIRTQKVCTVTLDMFCDILHISCIDCLKIDVEGFELEVLQGASNLLNGRKINIIIFELSKVLLLKLGKKVEDIFDIMDKNGYEIHNLSHQKIDKEGINKIIQEDVYAIPKI